MRRLLKKFAAKLLQDEPLIWTTKGNVPESRLKLEPVWEVTPECIKFSEVYTLDGEIVKQSGHIYLPKGESAPTAQGTF